MRDGDSIHVDPSNRDAYRAWDGTDGDYWAAHADHFDRAVAAYDEPLLAAAGIGSADRVLDLGCGTGHTTLAAARRAPYGAAFGVDLSARMIEVARRRAVAEGTANVSFLQADAQVHPFAPSAFDAAISRTGAMFFGDPVAAFSNVSRALRPGGRLTLLTWQAVAQNEWFVEFTRALAAGRAIPAPPPGAPGPFSMADPDRVRAVLTSSGFSDVVLDGVRAPMWFGRDVDDAERFVRGQGFVAGMLSGLEPFARTVALNALRASIASHGTPEGVCYPSAAWVVTARRA